MSSFKVALLGDSGVGKTSFIKKQVAHEFLSEHVATSGIETTPITFLTNHGDIKFEISEVAGYKEMADLSQMNAIIIMFDLTSKASFESAFIKWLPLARAQVDKVPIVFLGNKMDCIDVKVSEEQITRTLKKDLHYYYYYSVKSNYNFEKPLLYISRELKGEKGLVFVDTVA
jgi:GTP-binding nuclear protein Ran